MQKYTINDIVFDIMNMISKFNIFIHIWKILSSSLMNTDILNNLYIGKKVSRYFPLSGNDSFPEEITSIN
jgi:hypothetical protein